MAIRDIFKISFKTFFNPRGWLGYDALKNNSQGTFKILKEVFNPPEFSEPTAKKETFESAMKRYNLTPKDVKEIEKDYLFYAILFFLLGVFTLLLGIYFLIAKGHFFGMMLSIAVTSLFGSQAFRYHFWYFQIKRRKLGATFEEWRDSFFQNKKRPN